MGEYVKMSSGIEILVPVTIIGIVATGATTIYTSAQQKARDSIRQTDLLSIKSAVETYYGENGMYPNSPDFLVSEGYLPSIPRNPKGEEYVYTVFADPKNGIENQCYILSTTFENQDNQELKYKNDGGKDPFAWEIGVFCNP